MIYITKSSNYVLEQLIDWRGEQRAALTNGGLDQSPGENRGVLKALDGWTNSNLQYEGPRVGGTRVHRCVRGNESLIMHADLRSCGLCVSVCP